MHRLLAALTLCATVAFAQYTPSAGRNTPAAAYQEVRDQKTGEVTLRKDETAKVVKDGHGNASGNQYDLAVDGAFDGQTVLILDQVGNTLANTRTALREKGLNTVIYPSGATPSPAELKKALAKSCQLWLISTGSPLLNAEHIALIKAFFDAGHGVYIWGDNEPLYADANILASALVPGLRMEGNLAGNQVVGIADGSAKVGLRAGHLITTGLEHLYEGTSIATVQFTRPAGRNPALFDGGERSAARAPKLPEGFTSLLYGSAGNLVTVAYEKDGKRLMMDGGFTRLAVSWDDAGTARYVKNAAAWLVHPERFKETVAKK
ncbi:MAG: hypothetical protein Q8K32_31575 [Archangium sp.]|nr:hypothetical protein [Archangium sp.]